MRVVTYNIRGWRTWPDGSSNFARLVELLAEIQPDLIGLNEVFHPARETERAQPYLTALAAALDMEVAFGPCLRWPATQTLPERSYGNALLSRWPILASAAHHLADVPGKEQRGLLEARILAPGGGSFTVYVTHLDHTDETVRLEQLRSLRAWTVRDRSRPHLVMGDFNALSPWDWAGRDADLMQLVQAHPPSRYLLEETGMQVVPQMEKAGYVDAMRALGIRGGETFIPAPVPLRIDYVFLSSGLAPALRDAHIWMEPAGTEASDHRPVVVDLDDGALRAA